MSEHKRVTDKFCWIPHEKRTSRIPGPLPPRKPETRKPLYFLKFNAPELYFVNSSNETITSVLTKGGGIEKSYLDDEEYMEVGGPDFQYDSVKPQEAIKIEQYDPIGDSDSILFIDITVFLPTSVEKVFRVGKKGGIKNDMVLLWDNGDIGKGVSLET